MKQLSDEFGVSERTIQRDFEILEELGFPIEHQEDEYGNRFWRMPPDFFKTGPLVMGLTEAISLHLADSLLTPLSGTYLAEGLRSVLEKIHSLIPKSAMDYFATLDETIYVRRTGITDHSGFTDTIRTLVDAARSEQTVEVRYRAIWRGAEYLTLFDPYGLVYYEGDLFLIGRSHRANAIRIFRRMTSEDVLERLAWTFATRGVPQSIRSDNGSEFTAEAVRDWLAKVGVKTLYIEPESPWENGYVESFNGKLREELLDREIFYTLLEARVLIERWKEHYNRIQPHSSLAGREF